MPTTGLFDRLAPSLAFFYCPAAIEACVGGPCANKTQRLRVIYPVPPAASKIPLPYPSSMQPIVTVNNLSKRFKTFQAVDNLSFSISRGEVYGFLGQNGAGKSTTMRMMLGLIYPTSGNILINGAALTNRSRHLLRHTGAIIEKPDMYGFLSGLDNLAMFGALGGPKLSKTRMDELLQLVGLKGREHDRVKTYSQGMKQRLGIAIALSGDPDLLILDEPTNGLDPQGIADMRGLILRLSREYQKTVLISSHLLHEIEQVADSMLIIHRGKKIREGLVRELLDPKQTLFEVTLANTGVALKSLGESQWSAYFHHATDESLFFKIAPSVVPQLVKWLVAEHAEILEIKSTHSLEAYFLTLTHEHAH